MVLMRNAVVATSETYNTMNDRVLWSLLAWLKNSRIPVISEHIWCVC